MRLYTVLMNAATRAMFVIAVLVILGVAAYFAYPIVSRQLDGTASAHSFVLYLPQPWTSPNGEEVSGLISYDFAREKARVLYPLDARLGEAVFPSALSPDSETILAFGYQSMNPDDGVVLVGLSLAEQRIARVYANHEADGFVSPVWSPDGGRIAYEVRGLESEVGTSTLRIFPASEFQKPLGSGAPLAFSPDGFSLLVIEPASLAIVDTIFGSRVPLAGMENTTAVARVFAYPGATHIATLSREDGSLSFFRVDWERKTATLAGTVPDANALGAQAGFNETGDFILLSEDGMGRVYKLSGETYVEADEYELVLPTGARLVRWYAR